MSTSLGLRKTIKIQKNDTDQIIDLYNETIEDYQFWSRDCNMHFGYYIPFKTSFCKRDTMLNEMNKQVFDRLRFNKQNGVVLDIGCGLGGTMKYGLRKYPRLNIFGLTLSPFQVNEGNKRLTSYNGLILEEDYMKVPLADSSMDSAYAIESLCHSGHCPNALTEAYRLIKPGGRMVIADAFLKRDPKILCHGSSFLYKQMCYNWNLQGLASIKEIKKRLKTIGFTKIIVENISHRVAPSVLHIPFAIAGFILKKFWNHEPIKKESRKNLCGSVCALLSGLHMSSFGYYLITAEK